MYTCVGSSPEIASVSKWYLSHPKYFFFAPGVRCWEVQKKPYSALPTKTLNSFFELKKNRDNVALLVVVDVLPSGADHSTERSAEPSEEGPASNDSDAEQSSCSTGRVDDTNEPSTAVSDAPSLSAEDGAKLSHPGVSGCPSLAPRPAEAARLVIANTHLLFNPKRGDIKTAQLMVLTASVER